MTYTATEHAELIIESALSFLRGQFPIFPELFGKGRGVTRGRRILALVGFVLLFVVVVLVGMFGRTVSGIRRFSFVGLVLVGVVGLVVGGIRLVLS